MEYNKFHLGKTLARSKTNDLGHGAIRLKDSQLDPFCLHYSSSIKNDSKAINADGGFVSNYRLPDNEDVIFKPHPERENDGHVIYQYATDIYLLKKMPFYLSDKRYAPLEHVRIEGLDLRVVNVFILLGVKGIGHIEDGHFYGAKVKFLCKATTPVRHVLAHTVALFPEYAQGTFLEKYCKNVNFDKIGYDEKNNKLYDNPHHITQTGKYWSKLGLPWERIGKHGMTNPGKALKKSASIAQNGITDNKGIIFCNAWKRGNHLQSYPKSEKPNWKEMSVNTFFDILL